MELVTYHWRKWLVNVAGGLSVRLMGLKLVNVAGGLLVRLMGLKLVNVAGGLLVRLMGLKQVNRVRRFNNEADWRETSQWGQ